MKKARIEISQSEAQEIGRMLMNYGLVLDVLSGARDLPSNVSEFIATRRRTDFQKANARFERLMIKWCVAATKDKDGKSL